MCGAGLRGRCWGGGAGGQGRQTGAWQRVGAAHTGLSCCVFETFRQKRPYQMPEDWLARYGFRPVLLETFVEFERHRGTCYKAAN